MSPEADYQESTGLEVNREETRGGVEKLHGSRWLLPIRRLQEMRIAEIWTDLQVALVMF